MFVLPVSAGVVVSLLKSFWPATSLQPQLTLPATLLCNLLCCQATLNRSASSMDPTVADPIQRALIEQQIGFSLRDADPAALRFVVDRSREAGNAAFRDKDFKGVQISRCTSALKC